MNLSPESIQPAASFDWDTLVPILFFVLYGIAQLFGAKKKRKEAEEETEQPEVDPVERARQIREEIRRKIEERRRASEGGPAAPRYDPTKPDGQQQPARPMVRTLQPEPAARPVEVKRAQPVAPAAAPAMSLQERLQEQRALLEKARRQQQEAHERALQMERDAGAYGQPRKRKTTATEATGGSLRQQVQSALKDPNGLRKAVLYQEILGPPVGMR